MPRKAKMRKITDPNQCRFSFVQHGASGLALREIPHSAVLMSIQRLDSIA